MRIRSITAVALIALLALGAAGCAIADPTVFDRPQVESDRISAATTLHLDPASTRLLWKGEGRELYAAHRVKGTAGLCLVAVSDEEQQSPTAACAPGGRIGLGLPGGDEYLLDQSMIGEDLEGWEPLAEGLWRKVR